MPEIPENIKEKFATIAAQFRVDHPEVEQDAIVMFMMQIIETYDEYMRED